MRNFAVCFLCFFTILTTSFAQTKMTRKEYIQNYKELAIREMHRSGIPASIKLAQGCFESDNGNSVLAQKSNNHFGIKCKRDWMGERVFHNDDEENECFRKYKTVYDSYIDHTNFLTQNTRYAYLFKISHTDYNAWAHGLKAAGYATDPNYAQKIIKVIEDEKLNEFDNIKPDELPSDNALVREGKRFDAETRKHQGIGSFENISINPFEKREVKERNGLDVIYVKEGDTYESIAHELELKPWEIRVYNDLKKDAKQPEAGIFLYIQRKRCRAIKGNEVHTVQARETMYAISQKYGVSLRSLYCKNRMKVGSEPNAGTIVYLRKMKPANRKK
jgi:hypothetical protein